MATIEPFATAEDYAAIYGEPGPSDAARLPGLLLRATGYLMSYMDGYTAGEDALLDLNLSTVCCAMAHRAVCAPDGMEGVSQMSQTAGSYSVSVSVLDQYMRPLASELEMLGLGERSVVVSAKMTGGTHAAD